VYPHLWGESLHKGGDFKGGIKIKEGPIKNPTWGGGKTLFPKPQNFGNPRGKK